MNDIKEVLIIKNIGKKYSIGNNRFERSMQRGVIAVFGPLGKLFDRYLIKRNKKKKKQADNEVWALKDISFSVKAGSIVGIIGPNGAGKTTLLKILARVTHVTEGTVQGYGRVASLLGLGTGFNRNLTGRENIYLNAAVYGLSRSIVDEKLDEIISFADLREHIDKSVKYYSSGMFMRLAFSVAINLKPDILLADEVLAVGDINFQEKCLRSVSDAREKGVTTLFVSHDLEAITRLCDRVIWLQNGKIIEDGEPNNVVKAYKSFVYRDDLVANSQHKNSHCNLVSIKLENPNNEEIGSVKSDMDFFIIFSVHYFHDCTVTAHGFDLTVENTRLIIDICKVQDEVKKECVYEYKAKIPASLLAEKQFTITIYVNTKKNGNEEFLVAKNIKSFDVCAASIFNDSLSKKAMGKVGLISPIINWEYKEV